MSGVQSLERAVLILRVVGHHSRAGARLTDVTAATSLSQPTVHRILNGLMAEGFVAQDKENKRYFLGSILAELGITAAIRYDFTDMCRPSIARLASESEDTVFVSKRSGMDLICLDRRSGAFPSKAFVLDVGVRRPLGMGSSGLALLSALPADEARRILQENSKAICLFEEQHLDTVIADLARFSGQGYAVRDAPNADVRSVAAPICDNTGVPFACFSISTLKARMPMERVPGIAALLMREASWVQTMLRAEHKGFAAE